MENTLHILTNDKVWNIDGMLIEYFLGIIYTLEEVLLRVVAVSRKQGNMLGDFNETLISVIPKTNDIDCLDDNKPISLSNNIDKIVAKIIANRIKSYYQLIFLMNSLGF